MKNYKYTVGTMSKSNRKMVTTEWTPDVWTKTLKIYALQS
jgi:hypothetical protein